MTKRDYSKLDELLDRRDAGEQTKILAKEFGIMPSYLACFFSIACYLGVAPYLRSPRGGVIKISAAEYTAFKEYLTSKKTAE